jgi:hypothetical protein
LPAGVSRMADSLSLHIALVETGAGAEGELAKQRALADEIAGAMKGAAARLVHNEAVDGWLTLVFQGTDAEAMWEAAMPVIERRPLPRGSRAIKRWSVSGNEEKVRIDWDG